jgi:hypothetical protein
MKIKILQDACWVTNDNGFGFIYIINREKREAWWGDTYDLSYYL